MCKRSAATTPFVNEDQAQCVFRSMTPSSASWKSSRFMTGRTLPPRPLWGPVVGALLWGRCCGGDTEASWLRGRRRAQRFLNLIFLAQARAKRGAERYASIARIACAQQAHGVPHGTDVRLYR